MILQFPQAEARKRLVLSLYIRATAIDDCDPEEGIRLYRRIVELDRAHDLAMSNMGRLYYKREQFGAAETWWLRALQVNPRQVEALHNMGYLRVTQGAYSAAVEFLHAALTADERYADAHFQIAEALEGLGRFPEARVHWQRYVQLGGEYKTEALEALGLRVVK